MATCCARGLEPAQGLPFNPVRPWGSPCHSETLLYPPNKGLNLAFLPPWRGQGLGLGLGEQGWEWWGGAEEGMTTAPGRGQGGQGLLSVLSQWRCLEDVGVSLLGGQAL